MKTSVVEDSSRDRTSAEEVLSGGGDTGALMRALDWSKTPLGPVESWPQSLRSAISICLGSGFPINLYWGPEYVMLYNDGYAPIAGGKHPWALGRGAREVWPELWDSIGESFARVLATGEATYLEDSLLLMHRHGYTEECYFNYTLSPIRGESGRVEGIFNAVMETTYRVINARRNQVLRELGERVVLARSARDACTLAASTLGSSIADVTFCALYLVEDGHSDARLVAEAGLSAGAFPAGLPLEAGPHASWPLAEARSSGRVQEVRGLPERLGFAPPGGNWPEPTHAALVAPFLPAGAGEASGFLIMGASPRRAIDEDYLQFAERAAALVARAVSTATAFEVERKRAEALAELDRAKTVFFSNVSHEFRTPLTLMLGPTEDALASPDPVLRGPALEMVHRNELRLLKLVNTLLDFSRIEAGRIEASFVPMDLAELTRELASTFRSAVERAGLRLRVECAPLPVPVYVDRDMWEKIVLNLLSNALKFTFAGEISVRLEARGSHVELTVRDTGTGIPPEAMPRLFERFHRVQGARSRTHEGSGIGLALVRELVAQHGGSVRAESTLGEGTTFFVSLPTGHAHLPPERLGTPRALASTASRADAYVEEALRWVGAEGGPSSVPVKASPGERAQPLPGEGARILLADDNADMREYVSRLLGERWRVEAVADGRRALEAALREPPELVLTDVMMPGLDGFGLLRALRAEERTRSVPVIMLSARAGEEAHVEGLEAGADDYLIKPFSARELLARVGARLEISRLRRATEEQIRQLNAQLELKVLERTAQLQESNQELESFSYSVSHDLRAPLRHILGFAELLGKSAGGSLDDKSRRYLRTIMESAQKGGQLVDDLLAFSRLGRGELKRTRVDLVPLVDDLRAELAPEAEGRRVLWHVAPLPLVLGDPALLRLVLKNLLSNCLKYTRPRSEALIELSSEESPREVVIHVRDNGVGFEMQYVDKLFGVFQRLHTSEQFEGTGIGLANVRRIISRHGGRVWAEGAVDEGATFHFTLPKASPPEAETSTT
ncbi:two-component system sensor histidine kinase/response regulator [Cystobacter fuscus]|uniref:histidine kinase n=1 Tax=Cystobacter fuscus TaxID=43 RepID=A0A250IU92_9BACT|nr:ATP-binding protein [Cystobacter fuscus]ATB35325.1 two-component system sensor histidine kinase/response regulator [Cystobacter fuscus]